MQNNEAPAEPQDEVQSLKDKINYLQNTVSNKEAQIEVLKNQMQVLKNESNNRNQINDLKIEQEKSQCENYKTVNMRLEAINKDL